MKSSKQDAKGCGSSIRLKSLAYAATVAVCVDGAPIAAFAGSISTDWSAAVYSGGGAQGNNTGLVSNTGSLGTTTVTVGGSNLHNAGGLFTSNWADILPSSYLPIVPAAPQGVSVGYNAAGSNFTLTFSSAVKNPILMFNYTDNGAYNFGATNVQLIKFSGASRGSLSGGVLTISNGGNAATDGVSVKLLGTFTTYSFSMNVSGAPRDSAGFGIAVLTGSDPIGTMLTMTANQNVVSSLLNQRSSAIMAMMDYDCQTFDAKGFCVSFRARYTGMESQNEGAGVFTAAYRVNEKVRIGGFIDYRASEKDSNSIKQGDTMPTFGAFAAYSDRGNATGFQAKASAAYNSGKVTVTRPGSVIDNTEPGSGKAGLNSYAVGAELGWGFAVSPTMLATPYAGVRYSDATRKSYTEGTVAGTVDFPVSYAAYYQRLTTATAGIRLTGMLSDKLGYQASLGGEYDLAHSANAYSGTIPGSGAFALANTGSSNRSRVVASAGLYYQMDKTQRLTATVGVRGQAYSSQPSVTTLVGYQVAF